MKKIKILTAILLSLLFVLFAMGSGESSSSTGSDIDNNVADVLEPEENDYSTEKEISRGTVAGDVYTNDFIGFTFTKPSDWTFLSDDVIAERMGTTIDILDYNSVEQALAESATLYDMYAVDDYGNNVIIIYENTTLTAGGKITVDEYVDAFEQQFASLPGYEYEILASEDVNLGDASFTKLTSVLTIEGQAVNQATYIKIVDEYAITITVTPTTETVDSIEAMFG